MKKIKLYCLPFAGGSAMVYKSLFKNLDSSIELSPIELPGRGRRFDENLLPNLHETINDIIRTIEVDLENNVPYVLFGYSMGSLLAFELYYKIKSLGYPSPLHIFFCARRTPCTPSTRKIMHTLSDTELIQELKKLNGTPEEVFENKELLSIMLPIIRNDYAIIETYDYKNRDELIDCDISVINGCKDDINKTDLLKWRSYTSKQCKFIDYDGGHFFINEYSKELTDYINSTTLALID